VERLINISYRRFLSVNVTTKALGAFTIPLPYYLGPKVDGMTIHHTTFLSESSLKGGLQNQQKIDT